MAAFGTDINAGLGKIDYSGQLQGQLMGAQARGVGLNKLVDTAGQVMQDYYKKQEEKKIANFATSNIAAALTTNPAFQKRLGLQSADPKEIGMWLKAVGGGDLTVGAKAGLGIISQLAEEDRQAKDLARIMRTGDVSGAMGSGASPAAVKQFIDMQQAQSGMNLQSAQIKNLESEAAARLQPKQQAASDKDVLFNALVVEAEAKAPGSSKDPTVIAGIARQVYAPGGNGVQRNIPEGWQVDPKNPEAIMPTPNGPAALAIQEKKAKFDRSVADSKLKAQNVIEIANELLPKIDNWTAGVAGYALAKLPQTAAADLKQQLETIEANIGFDRLQEMRNNSPTGGALGNVSNVELDLLTKSWRSLKQSQSPEQLKANLASVIKHYNRFLMAIEGVDPDAAQAAPAQAAQQSARVRRYNPQTGALE